MFHDLEQSYYLDSVTYIENLVILKCVSKILFFKITILTSGKFFPRSLGSCCTQARAASYIFSSEQTEIVSLDMRAATSLASNSMNSSLDKTSVK